MNTLQYLFGPLADLYLPGAITLLVVTLVSSLLSVIVVLKRMAFVGQGVSHAGFGGVGLAAVLGFSSSAPAMLLTVVVFCLGAAFLIAELSRRRQTEPDTAIGIVLVASMAIGSILLHLAHVRHPGERVPGWESVLFGSLLFSGWQEMWASLGGAALIAGVAIWHRRPIKAWAFDESGAEAMGVNVRFVRMLVLALLAVAIVLAMKVVGVVLATALLVLPAAIALTLTDRWRTTLILSISAGMLGALVGLILSFEADWPPGASIVLAFAALYTFARLSTYVRPRLAPAA